MKQNLTPILNQSLNCVTCLVFVAMMMTGCGSDPNHDHGGEDHASAESTYVAGKGVQLSPSGLDSLGVKMQEVRIDHVQPILSVQAQVYRQANEVARPQGETRPGFAYASVFHPAEDREAVEIHLHGAAHYEGNSFSARIIDIDCQLVETTGQVEYLIEIDDRGHELTLGDFVQVTFSKPNADSEGYVIVPDSAVLRTARGDFAFAENQGYLFRAPVKVIRFQNNHALIAEGLYEGDLVAANQVENLYLIELQVTNGGKGCAHGH